jgi:hypothetical protein
MPSHVTVLLADVEHERKALNKVQGNQLNSAASREALRTLVERYFSEIRPLVFERSPSAEHLSAVDSAMQELLTLCHKRGSVQKYKDLLREIKANLIHLESHLISSPSDPNANVRTDQDAKIVTTLRALLPSAALSYEQALEDLKQPERLSWRGPATDLREALRETLDHLAPDADVIASPGYKQQPDSHGPTMKQKVRYILKNRGRTKGLSAPAEDAASAVDEQLGNFVRSVYTRSSVSTHTPTDKAEVERILGLVRVVLGELLEAR